MQALTPPSSLTVPHLACPPTLLMSFGTRLRLAKFKLGWELVEKF